MRLLYCSQDYSPHDHRFLSALSKTQHEVFWIRLEDRNRNLEKRELPSTIRKVAWREGSERVNWGQYLGLIKHFREAVEDIKPDLIHAGPIQPVGILPVMIHFHPLVSMSWGFDMLQDAEQNIFWRQLTQIVLARSDWLFCDCFTVKQKAVEWGFSSERITVFPWGVDLDIFKPAVPLKEAGKKIVLLSTRSWEPRYGMDVALKGFALAVQENPNLQLVLLSGGSQSEWIHSFIHENNLEKYIEIHGQISNNTLTDFYHEADVYLSASHIDGSSVALMEALACGTPALVSNIPSNLEWVRDGQEGWIFQDGDPVDLAKKILVITSHPNRLAAASKKARRRAEEKANWDRNVSTMLSAYEQILEEHQGE